MPAPSTSSRNLRSHSPSSRNLRIANIRDLPPSVPQRRGISRPLPDSLTPPPPVIPVKPKARAGIHLTAGAMDPGSSLRAVRGDDRACGRHPGNRRHHNRHPGNCETQMSGTSRPSPDSLAPPLLVIPVKPKARAGIHLTAGTMDPGSSLHAVRGDDRACVRHPGNCETQMSGTSRPSPDSLTTPPLVIPAKPKARAGIHLSSGAMDPGSSLRSVRGDDRA